MRRATVHRTFWVAASHQLPNYPGDCSRMHGHNYKIEIGVTGVVQEEGPYEGMVVDFKELKAIFAPIEKTLDHYHLNNVMPYVTTAEMIAHWIFEQLAAALPGHLSVASVKVWETENSYAEVTPNDRA